MQDIFLRTGARWKIVFNFKFDNNAAQKGLQSDTQHTHTHTKSWLPFFWAGGVSLCLPSAKHAEKEQSLRSVTFILNTWCDEKCISTGLSNGLSTWVSNLTTHNLRLVLWKSVEGSLWRCSWSFLFSFSVLRPNPGLSWWGNAASADLDYMLSSLLCPQNSLHSVALFIN